MNLSLSPAPAQDLLRYYPLLLGCAQNPHVNLECVEHLSDRFSQNPCEIC